MATVVLAAAGAALGGSVGGSVLGVGAAALGQVAGAVLGGVIDARVLGGGSDPVERGRATSLRLQTAEEGAPIPRVYGRMRVAGQLIWSTRFREDVATNGGGKSGPRVRDYSYTISFAVGLCEGPVRRIGRVWADGREIALDGVAWRLHRGTEDQAPDPLIEAVEGAAPGFRGLAYIVFEDLPVGSFGNRIPQISVEVFRRPRSGAVETAADDLSPQRIVKAVAMSPGSGEFAYDTEPVRAVEAEGVERVLNVNTPGERTDAVVSLDQLEGELPACKAVSLVVSWFGTDLRADRCELKPGVEYRETRTAPHVWRGGGETRATAHLVGRDAEGRPVYGGTPSDGSVVRYIRELKARGIRVTFYPFILMDVAPGNGLIDPWTGEEGQPAYPWRGRITTSLAPGVAGSPDGTAPAADEVAAFFGTASPGEFASSGDTMLYAGAAEWGMRRFILHYAHLCALAGGVDAFCIGSEMRGVTQIRSARTEYPAVEAFRALARDVRAVLGPSTKIGYAADWSEYFGHQPQDGTGDRLFHLDPLWADDAIDFVGIDWYAPVTDWRDGRDHLDAEETGSIYDLEYLTKRLAAGEGFDWYYASEADRAAQIRTPIRDTAHGEDWIWRSKDLESWWSKRHHERVNGMRAAAATAWRPKSKPIWLTEIGCGAVDKGTNQPNVFVDPKSSENALPHFSDGSRDDLIQRRLLQAATQRWSKSTRNPVSPHYGAPMLDLDNCYVWTWDARPWPAFPDREAVWTDGDNYRLGHWIDGRAASADLDALVAEICRSAGVKDVDVSQLAGLVEGFVQPGAQAPRAGLEALMLAYGFDMVETAGVVRFVPRGRERAVGLQEAELVAGAADGRDLVRRREEEGVALARVRIGFLRSDGDYRTGSAEAINPETDAEGVQGSDLPIAMTRARAAGVAERWARESEMARETARFALGPVRSVLEPGDVVRFGPSGSPEYRIDRIAQGTARAVEATRIEPAIYARGERNLPPEPRAPAAETAPAIRPGYRLLDLPWSLALPEERKGFAAVWADPWPGSAALYASDRGEGFEPIGLARRPTEAGVLAAPLPAGAPWRIQRGPGLRVRLFAGSFASVDERAFLNGANTLALAAPGGGWELLQFREAELVGPDEWRLAGLLRGVGGTETSIGDPTPEGSVVVALSGRLTPIEIGEALTGIERTYRIGPASVDLGNSAYAEARWTYVGAALTPHAPVRVTIRAEGDALRVSWIRRGRRDADVWVEAETPLFEAEERYRLRIRDGTGAILRTATSDVPEFLYEAAERTADGTESGPLTIEVAQISTATGPGHYGKASYDG